MPGRALTGSIPDTFTIVFMVEALLFLVAASLALRAAPQQATMPIAATPA